MSLAYINGITTHLKNAVIVVERFLIVKLYNEKLCGLRRQVYHARTDKAHKEVLKGPRSLLPKNPAIKTMRCHPHGFRERNFLTAAILLR